MKVWYMSGAGNDFMVIDGRGMGADHSELAKKLCALKGADGFMAVDYDPEADFRLHFYNSDGSRGEMCGNGSRCVSRFAYDHGIAPAHMTIRTDAGPVEAWRLAEDRYQVRLNNPGVMDLHRLGEIAYVELGSPGVPHAVVEDGQLEHDSRERLRWFAQGLRYDPAFPKGANVNFFRVLEPGRVRILTYERGVEDYTLACGTGSASTAAVLWLRGRLPGGKAVLENPGGDLELEISGEQGEVTRILMSGPAELVEELEIH